MLWSLADKVIRLKRMKTNEDLVKIYLAILTAKLHGYEAILSKQKYMAGDVRFLSPLY